MPKADAVADSSSVQVRLAVTKSTNAPTPRLTEIHLDIQLDPASLCQVLWRQAH